MSHIRERIGEAFRKIAPEFTRNLAGQAANVLPGDNPLLSSIAGASKSEPQTYPGLYSNPEAYGQTRTPPRTRISSNDPAAAGYGFQAAGAAVESPPPPENATAPATAPGLYAGPSRGRGTPDGPGLNLPGGLALGALAVAALLLEGDQ